VAFTILLADDSMTAQNMGKKILTQAGYQVVAVSNGAAAVKKIAEHKPDLAVLDVYMPGYTGLEVCERVRNAMETNTMPILLSVGKMENFNQEEAARVKADGIIVKPFEASDLLAAVQRLEERLNPKAKVVATSVKPEESQPEYERTIRIAAPVFDEQDETYQAWKSEAEEHVEEHMPPTASKAKISVPEGMGEAPAFTDELGTPPPMHRVTEEVPPPESIYTAPTAELGPEDLPSREGPPVLPGKAFQTGAAAFGGASALDHLEEIPAAQPAPEPELPPAPTHEMVKDFEHFHTYGSSSQPESAFTEEMVSESLGEKLTPEAIAAVEEIRKATGEVPAMPMEAPGEPPPALPAAAEPAAESTPSYSSVAPGFEPTSLQETHEVAAGGGMDPALVTDVAEMSTAFPTKFGVEGAEPVHVGIAAEFPALYGDAAAAPPTAAEPAPADQVEPRRPTQEIAAPETPAGFEVPVPAAAEALAARAPAVEDAEFERRVAAAMRTSWAAEETHVEEHEHGVMLHEEMQKQFAEAQPEPAPEPPAAMQTVAEPEPSPVAISAARENAPDPQLAAAMAAAVGAGIEPSVTEAVVQSTIGESTMPIDQHTAMIADIVQRVTERMRSTLVVEISRELAEELKKGKK